MTDTNSNSADQTRISATHDSRGEHIILFDGVSSLNMPLTDVPEVLIKMAAAALEAGLDNAKFDKSLDYLMDVVGGGDDE